MQEIIGGIISVIGILIIVLLVKERAYEKSTESDMIFLLSLILTAVGIFTVLGIFD